MSAKSVTLKNNILLITEGDAQAKTASIGFWFAAGSRFENETQHGVAHFTEHMLFKGTDTHTTHDISCAFDRLGGYANAFTEREDVCVYCTVPATEGAVEKACEIFCDMASHASFKSEELEKERTVIQNEIAAVEDDPEEAALDEVAAAVWPKQDISRSIGGTVDEVEQITREQLVAWYDEKIVHGEMTVCAAGHFDEKEIVRLLETLPMHAKVIEYPKQNHFTSQQPKWQAGSAFKKSHFKQEQYFVLYPFHAPVNEKEYYALTVMNALAGDTMSSRLFETLREKSGFCYTVYSFFTFYEDACAWCAYASSDKNKAKQVSELLLDEVAKLVTNPATCEEIEAAIEHCSGEEAMNSEEMEYVMKRLARNHQMGFPLRSTEETCERIRAVTKDDIIGIIEELLCIERSAFISYGPKLPRSLQKEIICRMQRKTK